MMLDRLTRTWWVRLPRQATRLSAGSAFAVADGHFLAAYPLLGAVATPLAVASGLIIGSFTLDYSRGFTESLTVILIGVALGFLATQLGAAYLVGFAVGDFVVGQPKWVFNSVSGNGLLDDGVLAALVRLRLPMLIGYLLFAVLIVAVPVLIRRLLEGMPGLNRLPPWLAAGVAALLNVVVVYAGVRLWTSAAPVLIRPLYTWSSNTVLFGEVYPAELTIPLAAIQTLQRDGVWIVRVAILVTLLRFGLLWLAWQSRAFAQRLEGVEAALAEPSAGGPPTPYTARIGKIRAALLGAAVTTFILAGMMTSWWVAALFFAEFVLPRLLTTGAIPLPIDPWRRLMSRIPLLLRLAAALIVVQTIAAAVLDEKAATFTPLALYMATALAVLVALMPGQPRETKT